MTLNMTANSFLGILIVCGLVSDVFGEDYHCWDESERVNLTFENNDKIMTHLPTIRLIQGYYPSQFAIQYSAYVFLTEKMGINVEFYPSNDPNALFDRYSNWTFWCNSSDINAMSLSSNQSCSPYAPYPRFYFEDILNDKYDLLFEIWDIMVSNADGNWYFDNDYVSNGGINGVYGEANWFTPKYVYDNNPEWILPHNLKYNKTLQQMYIDAYTINSDQNYIDKWWNVWGDHLNDYPSEFDLPNNNTPIIFGSITEYAMSRYSDKLVKNIFNGTSMNWSFVPFGTESLLTEFVTDLYLKGLPFIANLYTPHLDFATIINGKYMEFERIALPRNPSNAVNDQCYIKGECSSTITPLIKLGNPKLKQTFPEMYEFLLDFKMSTNDANNILAYHVESLSYNLTDHQRWINATCKYFKDTSNNGTYSEWKKEIIRYDCHEINDCGYHYYYNSYDDAINQNNPQLLNQSITGYCLNRIDKASCNCPNEYLVGSGCNDSCPGLIGPILSSNIDDDDNNIIHSTTVQNDYNYTFYLCNGHGTCTIRTRQCECELGFSGKGCEIEFEIFEYNLGFTLLFSGLCVIFIIILILSIIWLWMNQNYKTVKALSAKMTTFFSFGLILLCLGTILYLFHPLNDHICNWRNYFYGTGAVLSVVCPLCKTYRVAIIFAQARNLKRINIPDTKLLIYLIAAAVLETLICVLYTILHQLNGGTQKVYFPEWNRIEVKCNQSDAVSYINSANYLYIFTLIMILCFFSFKNRKTHKIFKESKCAYFGSFFSLFVFIVVVVFNMVVDDISYIITIQSSAMLIALGVIWTLFYGVRIYDFFMYPDQRQVTFNSTSNAANNTNSYITNTNNNNTNNNGNNLTPIPTAQTDDMPSYVNELYKARGFESTTERISENPNSKTKTNSTDIKLKTIISSKQLSDTESIDENASLKDNNNSGGDKTSS